jgi:DNA-binding NtrC family response regulator
MPDGSSPAGNVPTSAPSLACSFVTLLLLLLATQMLILSNANATGLLPTANVPSFIPSLARSFVTVLLWLFATQIREDAVRNLTRAGHEVKESEAISDARASLRQEFDAIIADLWLPEDPSRIGETGREMGGWSILIEAKDRYPSIRRVAISAKTDPEEAKKLASELGVDEFIPVVGSWVAELVDLTNKLVKEREEERLRASLYSDEDIEKQLRQVVAYEKRDPSKHSPAVLLVGETGTGKGHWAGELFKLRQQEGISTYFKNVNCAALAGGDALLVQLFGALPGFFRGTEDVPGLFELMDHRWTVFLDEVGKVNKTAQGALLKLIDERETQRFPFTEIFPLRPPQAPASERQRGRRYSGRRPVQGEAQKASARQPDEYERLRQLVRDHFPDAIRYHQDYGYNEPKKFKGRIVAAANINLIELVRKDLFLIDLYNRLMCFAIKIPTLRERGPDYIKRIALDFVKGKGVSKGISREALDLLSKHEWRAGNRRELLLTLEAAIMRADLEGPIAAEHLVFVDTP